MRFHLIKYDVHALNRKVHYILWNQINYSENDQYDSIAIPKKNIISLEIYSI